MDANKLESASIARESPDQPDIRALLSASDAHMAALYPTVSNHLWDVSALMSREVTFLVARVSGRAVGCGALARSSAQWGEIKRMFVRPEARGRQLGRMLLQRLEAIAMEAGVTVLRLETGIRQPEALALYRSAGFVDIGPFGKYLPDPNSVFLEKRFGGVGSQP